MTQLWLRRPRPEISLRAVAILRTYRLGSMIWRGRSDLTDWSERKSDSGSLDWWFDHLVMFGLRVTCVLPR
jgi:hypothetical protein